MNLADHTTLGLGGPARRFVRAGTEEDLIEAVRAADLGGDPGAVTEFGVRFSAPVVVPDDDKGATVEVAGTVTGRLEGNRVAVDVTARSDGRKVLTRASAVLRLS